MTGPSLDLDALREWCEMRLRGRGPNETRVELYAYSGQKLANAAEQILAVLALVEEQRKALDRLLPYSDHLRTCAITGKRPPGVCTCGYLALLDALAGSPAENKEPS